MNCPKCNAEISDTSNFCQGCGTKVSSESRASRQEQDRSIGDLKTIEGGMAKGAGCADEEHWAPLASRYELMEEIGQGGFATVWKARDKKLGRMVAVKRLLADKLQGTAGELALARFRREAQAIAQLKHRNIVEVYDVGRDAEGDYLVMELVEGGSLRDLLKQPGLIPETQAIELVKGIARGLAYAHKKNLVHRDIKPANILLAQEGEDVVPKIVDLGLARVGSESDLSLSGYGMGTPFYMPPEQRRDAKSVNHTADIYALGKTFYEMLTEEVPDQVDPEKIPPHLAKIVLRCVKNNPEERYFSADDLIAELESAQGSRNTADLAGRGHHAGENTCVSCGADNPSGVEFCESCGAGLSRSCPECGRKISLERKYCGGCGTDIAGFLAYAAALPRMEKFCGQKQWSRVEKEYGLLPKSIRLPGAKGKEMVRRAEDWRDRAAAASAEFEDETRVQMPPAAVHAAVPTAVKAAEPPKSLFKCFLGGWKKYAVFSGRARRREYWGFFLFSLIIQFFLTMIGTNDNGDNYLVLYYFFASLLPFAAVSVRRLHDTGKSGGWLFILFIPILGPFIFLIFMLLEGEAGANKYGPNPKE